MTPFAIAEVHDVAKKSVELVTLKNTQTGERHTVATEGVFVAIGHDPEHESLQGPAQDGRKRLPDHPRWPQDRTSREFSPPATSRIITIARQLRRLAPAAWRRSK